MEHVAGFRLPHRTGRIADFGNATDWSKTFIGRFQGVESTITAINFNPSIAWKLHEDVSLGVGLNVVKFDADLRNIVPVTALLPVPVEVETKLKGDDVGFGYNLGVMFRLSAIHAYRADL